MIRCVMLSLTFFLSTIVVAQQNNGDIPQQNPNTSSASHITLRGCVNGGERYTFIESDTGSMFNIVGNTEQVASVTGKFAEVTARELPPARNSATAGPFPQIEIQQVKVLSDVCPVKSKVPKPNQAPQSSTPTRSSQASVPGTTPYSAPGAANQTSPTVGNNPNSTGATGPPSPGTGNPPPTKPQ